MSIQISRFIKKIHNLEELFFNLGLNTMILRYNYCILCGEVLGGAVTQSSLHVI